MPRSCGRRNDSLSMYCRICGANRRALPPAADNGLQPIDVRMGGRRGISRPACESCRFGRVRSTRSRARALDDVSLGPQISQDLFGFVLEYRPAKEIGVHARVQLDWIDEHKIAEILLG